MVDEEFSIRMCGRVYYFTFTVLFIVLVLISYLSNSPRILGIDNFLFYGSLVLLLIFSLIISVVYTKVNEIEVTSSGVTARKGLLNTKTVYIPYHKVDNVRVNVSLIERIFGLGQLIVDSTGGSGLEIHMSYLPYPILTKMLVVIKRNIHEVKKEEEEEEEEEWKPYTGSE
ncbi:PH domain-containing protein [Candidatus Micrarchaeota archaeon]|nr:PH domain-containing protein [Candidatus Micrarchaeota archaeon]